MLPEFKFGVISISATIAGFYFYHYLTEFKIISSLFSEKHHYPDRLTVTEFVSAKMTGFLFLGLLPFLFFVFFTPLSFTDLGLTFGETGKYWYLIIVIPVLAVLITSQASKNQRQQEVYPQMRLKRWGILQVGISFGGWAIYLFAYEFLFRGILWFLCYKAFGFLPALVINLSLYSSLHMPKGIKETLGAIPVGFLLCIFSYLTGSFFLAFITHLAIASSTELFSVYHNPDMHYSNQ
jgi:membrane protease YdiL (CAAX protease family)